MLEIILSVILILYLIKKIFDLTQPMSKENMDNKVILYYFYMNGCGYCTRFNPVWDAFSKKYQGNVLLKKIERADAGSLLNKYNVRGFPTVILDKGNSSKTFNMDRTVDNLLSFVK